MSKPPAKVTLKVLDLEGHKVEHLRPGVAFVLEARFSDRVDFDSPTEARFRITHSILANETTKTVKRTLQGTGFTKIWVADTVVPWATKGDVTFKLTRLKNFKHPPELTLPIRPYAKDGWP
jgi:hypothetical protein